MNNLLHQVLANVYRKGEIFNISKFIDDTYYEIKITLNDTIIEVQTFEEHDKFQTNIHAKYKMNIEYLNDMEFIIPEIFSCAYNADSHYKMKKPFLFDDGVNLVELEIVKIFRMLSEN